MPFYYRWLILGLGLATAAWGADTDIPGVTIAVTRPIYPLLVRNPAVPLVRVILDVGKVDPSDVVARNDVRLTSIAFAISGSGAPGDLASLSLLSGGEDGIFGGWRSPAPAPEILAGPMPSAATVTFTLDRWLHPGRNVLWLAGLLRDEADLSHRIAARCTAVMTNVGGLTSFPPPSGPALRLGVALRRHGEDGVDTYRIPALAATAKGTLLCVYDMRWRAPGNDLQDHITTGLSRSVNGGRSWEPMRTIMDMGSYGGLPPEQNGCSDPGIVVDRQTGESFCFAVWMNGKPRHHQWRGDGSEPGYAIGRSAQLLLVRSRDEGVTWSQPENLTHLKREAWYLLAPAPNHGIQLHGGTLVMPAQGRDEAGREFSTLITSSDHGAHWTVGTPIPHAGASECQAVELGDCSVMLNFRNETKDDTNLYRGVYVTRDLGRTWQPHGTNLNRLIEPDCNASLLRMDYSARGESRHVLIFANPHTHVSGDRTHQTLQVSFDEGATWPRDRDLLIDEGRGAGYPSLERIDERTVGIVYEGSQADLIFQTFTLDELLKGPAPVANP